MNPANVLSACAQIAVLVGVCAAMPRALGLRSPVVHYLYWRILLAVCLLLPLLAPRVPDEMVFVPAPAGVAAPMHNAAAAPSTAAAAPAAPLDWWRIAAIVVVAGVALRLAWMSAGILRLIRMRARAHDHVQGFDDLARTIGATARILWSSDVTHPVTFGVLRPVVLLPMALKSVDAAAQRAVVAHELHHVKRRDWLWVVAEEVTRSVLWFHPAVWWLISRVQLARETVVDELSILTTNARRTYLDTLLAFADDTGLDSSPAFSARRHLFHRVMLLSREEGMSSIRIAAASCVLAVAIGAGSWSAVSAFPLHVSPQIQPPPPPPPPSDPLSPEAYTRLASSYLDQFWKDRTLADSQKIELARRGIAAADRALELKPNYAAAMIWKSILLRTQAILTADSVEQSRLINEADVLREQAIVLQDSGRAYVSRDPIAGPPPPPPPPPPRPGAAGRGGVTVFVPKPAGSAEQAFTRPSGEAFEHYVSEFNPIRIGGNVKAPAKIRDVRPVYPPIAQAARVQGVVIIEAVIDPDGNVAEARVLRSIPLLDQAALDAVKEWKYVPTSLNGVPQAVIMTVTVNFALQ
jgi:protein TonB